MRSTVGVRIPGLLVLAVSLIGCGNNNSASTGTTKPQTLQNYFAPTSLLQPWLTNTIDDANHKYSQIQYGDEGTYSEVLTAGNLTVNPRGLRILGFTTQYATGSSQPVATYDPPLSGGFALELAGQAGGLIQPMQTPQSSAPVVVPVKPMVAAINCPNFSAAQTYLFITLLGSSGGWNAATDTAYGTVDISTNGTAVNFNNIAQFTLPSAGVSGTPAQPSSATKSGVCNQTSFGQLVAVPGQVATTDPGGIHQSRPPQAQIGIGPNQLLVEDNGSATALFPAGASTSPFLPYENVLGAGYGAVGLPRSSSPVDTGSAVGSQYLGFVYATGDPSNPVSFSGSSHVASFGFSAVPSACSSVAASTSTLIYGGDFKNDDPSSSSDGFGNCDFAIDLGPQDSANNGLYRNATVWVGAGYSGNTTGENYSFSAVAIAGQLSGKYAIFLLGKDASQPWAIYLLQSN
ncbi:hypothetical protein [Acidicapsa ligni]|uniref:hypothetical protein n=1 Tax=Acidicapsa ligni TaxID=542300 RepID=UPI0021DF4498|nr:hypothetical protein [Acidicapsa ligni]